MNKMHEEMGSIPLGGQFKLAHSNKQHGGGLAQLWRFLRHLMEMIPAMIVGMAIWGAIVGLYLRPLGYGDLGRTYPEIRFGLMAIFMSVPMVLLMRFHKHSWERGGEMVGAMVAPIATIVLCWRLGLGTYIQLFSEQALPASTHIAMILGMLLLMLYRRNEYLHAPSHTSSAHVSA